MPRVRPPFIFSKSFAIGAKVAVVAALGGLQSAAYAEKGWELTQYSDYLGPEKVLVSKSAIKVTAEKYGVSLMSCAPKFQIMGVNDRTRCYYVADYDTWQARLGRQAEAMIRSPSQQDGKAKVAGVWTMRYMVDASHGGARVKDTAGFEHNTVLYIYPEIKTSPKFLVLLATIAYVPSNLGFPLKVLRHRNGLSRDDAANDSVIWDTRSIKSAEVPTRFDIPTGYTRVDTEMALFIGGGTSASLAATPASDAAGNAIGINDTRLWVPGDGMKNDDLFDGGSHGGESVTIDDVYEHVREGKSLRGARPMLSKGSSLPADAGRAQTVDDLQNHAGQWAPGL